ncbi:MAG: helix-turn-helix domain-containing protein [Muribaculaceae bacterium]|nr:helix-turn-helix domain-containing protein [Muribaculaceae bacterium]
MRKTTGISFLKRSLCVQFVAAIAALACYLPSFGAPADVDSLYHVYINAGKAHRIQIVNTISRELFDTSIIDTVYQCSTTTPDARIEAIANLMMGKYLFDQERYEAALDKGTAALDIVKADKKADAFRSDILGLVSDVQFRLGDYDQALNNMIDAYEDDTNLGSQKLISNDLNSLASICLIAGQTDAGIKFIEKAIELERKLKRPDRLASRLSTASELYLINHEPNKAMDAIDEAYSIDKESHRDKEAAIRLVQKGAVLEEMSRLNEARSTLMQAIPVLEKHNATYSLAHAYNLLGSIETKLGNQQEATACYKKALEYSIKSGAAESERIAERGLCETMRDSNPAVALIHLERYTALSDSLNSEMKSVQQRIIEVTDLNTEKTQLDLQNKRFNRMLSWASVVIGFLLIGALAGLFFSWRKAKETLKLSQHTEELRKHLLNNITNKLQTPLTVVLNAGHQLLEGRKTSADENKHLGTMIVTHGQNMLGLVNNLIDIEKVSSSIEQPEFKRGDIVMFVRMLVDNFAEKAHQQLISLEFSSPLNTYSVVFAPDYIRRIVHALIINALKFTDRNGDISVNLEALKANRMQLTVTDTGKGIPVTERDRIFEPFYQSSNDEGGVETGLDLSLVYQLAKAMNGTITVDSELERGTTFTIIFPVQVVEDTRHDSREHVSDFAENLLHQNGYVKQKPLVFIAENNEDVAFFIASHMGEEYNLRFAKDGREVLRNAQCLVPDLIITSITMPVMGGKELISKLREDPTLNHIPIIAMTSNTSEQERISCFEAGADGVLVKPFYSSELRILAKHLINKQATLRERFVSEGNEFNNDEPAPQRNKEDQEFINKLVDVIHTQMIKDDIDMEHIAAALSLSRKQLRTRVMAITGLTPVAYVLQVRLNYARRIISTENISLTEVAGKCGFQNLSHFSKAFKQQFGVSPLQFRKNIDDVSHTRAKN